MRRLLLPALICVLASTGVAGAAGQVTRAATSRGPFVPNGELAIRGTNRFDGDRSLKHRSGMQLGCLAGRPYAFAVVVRNRSAGPVTLTGVRGPNPAPRIIDRIAVQVRFVPPPPSGDQIVPPLISRWSSARTHPLRVRPGHSAIVQTNFRMGRCSELAHGRSVAVPGSLVLRYSASGHTGTQRVVQPDARFVVVEGPTIGPCSPVAGAIRMAASDVSCSQARAAAPVCHHGMSHGRWGTCSAAGRVWSCYLPAVTVQKCSFPNKPSHWFRVRWEPKKR
jgi:hypothetical protein